MTSKCRKGTFWTIVFQNSMEKMRIYPHSMFLLMDYTKIGLKKPFDQAKFTRHLRIVCWAIHAEMQYALLVAQFISEWSLLPIRLVAQDLFPSVPSHQQFSRIDLNTNAIRFVIFFYCFLDLFQISGAGGGGYQGGKQRGGGGGNRQPRHTPY